MTYKQYKLLSSLSPTRLWTDLITSNTSRCLINRINYYQVYHRRCGMFYFSFYWFSNLLILKRTWRRLSYMTKVIIHDEGYRTWRRLSYMTKVIVHDEGYHTRRRLSYMTKVIIHDEGYRTWRRLSYMTKVIVHDEGYRTWRRSQKRVVRTKLDNYAFITNRMIF